MLPVVSFFFESTKGAQVYSARTGMEITVSVIGGTFPREGLGVHSMLSGVVSLLETLYLHIEHFMPHRAQAH